MNFKGNYITRGASPIERQGPCPVCGEDNVVPVMAFSTPRLCNVLFDKKQEAADVDLARVVIRFCRDCTHVFNGAFEGAAVRYTARYDSSLEHSPRFSAFVADLVKHLDHVYSLGGKSVLEIGCGKGEFLKRLCSVSGARGIGFDASYSDESHSQNSSNVIFVRDYFSDHYRDVRPDLVVCRHVLEHIDNPVSFLLALRMHPGVGPNTYGYFEVPNALYTLRDHGIWDLIYEHASYFTLKSLCLAFELAGYEVRDAGTTFGEQYLYANVRMKQGASGVVSLADSVATESMVSSFAEAYRVKIDRWANRLENVRDPAGIVVWGAGSKGITFVNAVPGGERIGALIDLNPHKQGRFAPRHGTPVVSPDDLKTHLTDIVVIMNPIYADEIARSATAIAPRAELILA